MDDEEAPKEISIDATKSLTIKIANSGDEKPASSPSFSPPSSAFVSALQSPYISPRATSETPTPATTLTHSSPPVSYSGSQSDDLPCTSYIPAADAPPPRISFSFPAPRASFAKSSASPAKLRSCDVYIGYHGQNPNLVRFCKWLKSELEIQGIACFVADRAKYSDGQSHEIADRVICSVAFGVVVVASHTLNSRLSLEEIRFFAQKKNLIPIFFDAEADEIATLFNPNSDNREAVDALLRFHDFKLEANDGNWRNCISRTAGLLRNKLGRKSVTDKEPDHELPFPRNKHFVGRERDINDIETAFFGSGDYPDQENIINTTTSFSHSDGLADGESEADGRYISLDIGRFKEPSLEAWVEKPAVELRRSSTKKPKCKKSKPGKYSSVVCVNGASGVGKTELALEFAHRHSQRYKMVLWVGGEARYFRQNILNISRKIGMDISADEEKERGKIRSFEEQESEAFKRVKRELFRDTPYLLIIDNLESEREWWEGKDLHDLLPRNTGGTHVIITTRLSRVMTLDPIHLPTLSQSEAMVLIRGRRKRESEYPASEVEFIRKFDEKLERSSFGLWVVGCLITELSIMPSALFEAVNDASRNNETYTESTTNPFLVKVMSFSGLVLEQTNLLALRMLQVGAWLAPAPVSICLLAAAAKNMPFPRSKLKKCCLSFTRKSWKNEEESALVLIRLGLARRVGGKKQGCWIQFHPITQAFGRWKYGLGPARAAVEGVRRVGNPSTSLDHLWASAFLVFGFKSEAATVDLRAAEMVSFVKRAAIPLAVEVYGGYSRCGSGLEVLKVCTEVLEEVEKRFVCEIERDLCSGWVCWKKGGKRVDEYLWEEVTLVKAAAMEMRAKMMARGGEFDGGEELCRGCVSIRTVMLGHGHGLTLAAQETLARLVRMRSKSM